MKRAIVTILVGCVITLLTAAPAQAQLVEPSKTPAPTQAQPVESSKQNLATHTVVRGDTLGSIAKRFCGTFGKYVSLARASGIRNPDLIYPGQRVVLNCTLKGGAATSTVKRSTTQVTAKGWQLPLSHYSLTSCYGMRWGHLHRGLDMAAPWGTPLHAIGSGVVKVAGRHWGGYGIEVIIAHPGGVYSHYAHMSSVSVRAGQHVSKGQTIGRLGSTGDSTGPHVHLEIMKSLSYGSQVNPAPWLRAHGVRVGC
jgi:murein DD-endopeptidase MepM/ murein hydrolase activator NlpD